MSAKIIFQTNQLSKNYGQQFALDHFDLTVRQGEIIGIAGPNGAGKTTLFKILTGLTPHYDGTLTLFDESRPHNLQQMRRYIGAVIEEPAFYPELSARENLEVFRLQRGVVEVERVEELLELFGLDQTGKKALKHFSLGMKQRLAMAQSLLHRPDLLIFDEPINGLDPQVILDLRQIFHHLAHDLNLTLLISSHILSELEEVCDRFVIINHGQKLREFTKQELHTMTKDFYLLRVDQPKKAATVIEQQLHTENYEIDAQQAIRFFDLTIDPALVNRTLVQNDIQVSELAANRLQLEDLFMQIVSQAQPNKKG
ncbi:MAG: ABC transporter ATP-binding protein [Aerococcus sp.]|nr:ABC transporter ATP-binding protein [Aerococcus sp.]